MTGMVKTTRRYFGLSPERKSERYSNKREDMQSRFGLTHTREYDLRHKAGRKAIAREEAQQTLGSPGVDQEREARRRVARRLGSGG